MVITRLWNEEVPKSQVLKLKTFERLGGANEIIKSHLNRVMKRFSRTEKSMCAKLFYHLVTPSGTKIAHRPIDLAGYLKLKGPTSEKKVEKIKPILNKFSSGEMRILRPTAGERYEIFHDAFSEAILAWRARYEQSSKTWRNSFISLTALIILGILISTFLFIKYRSFVEVELERSRTLEAEKNALVNRLTVLSVIEEQVFNSGADVAPLLVLQAFKVKKDSKSTDGVLRTLQSLPHINITLQGHSDDVLSVAFSPDGSQIISSSSDKTVRLWDTKTGKSIGKPWLGHNYSKGYKDYVLSLAFSPDGSQVVSGSRDNTVRLWDVKTGTTIGEPLEGHSAPVYSVAFSPDGSWVISGSSDTTIRLWDAKTGKVIGEPWLGHKKAVRSTTFSPDGFQVVSGSSDGTLRLWHAETGAAIGEPWQGHDASVMSVAFSPDGSQVVSGSRDSTLRLWNVKTGEVIGEPWQGHSADVLSVTFSINAPQVVSGSSDKTVRLWDAKTGEAIGEPWLGHSAPVSKVAFSTDGSQVVSGSADDFNDYQGYTILIWDADEESWVERLCHIAGRNFTQIEWKKYLGDKPYEKTCPLFPEGL